MKKKKQNDCVDLKNRIQEKLYEEYKGLADEERAARISKKLTESDAPIGTFWRHNVLQVADEKVVYKRKDK